MTKCRNCRDEGPDVFERQIRNTSRPLCRECADVLRAIGKQSRGGEPPNGPDGWTEVVGDG